ncbi:MAG: hypothetical protein OEY72_09415, partial [Gammaproteobacteria bacterium]|nr:hypothetical protein [Gammaproteobacteria bacterium]
MTLLREKFALEYRLCSWVVVLWFCVLMPATSYAQESFVVRDMRVEGLQRISEGTVFNYLPVNVGDSVDGIRIQ